MSLSTLSTMSSRASADALSERMERRARTSKLFEKFSKKQFDCDVVSTTLLLHKGANGRGFVSESCPANIRSRAVMLCPWPDSHSELTMFAIEDYDKSLLGEITPGTPPWDSLMASLEKSVRVNAKVRRWLRKIQSTYPTYPILVFLG